jgi:hypothetical protein
MDISDSYLQKKGCVIYLYEKSHVVKNIFEKISKILEKIRVNFRGLTIAFVSIMLGLLLIVLLFLYLYQAGILK